MRHLPISSHGEVSSQFGAFLFGARQFDVCQFGALHFDAVPLRGVSVWRDASLARFTLARFPILCLCNLLIQLIQYSMQFWFFFCEGQFYLCACFLSAHVFCEEVLSTPVCREATLLGLLWRAYHFLRIFPSFMRRIVCVIYLLTISTRHRYSIANKFVYRRCFFVSGSYFY